MEISSDKNFNEDNSGAREAEAAPLNKTTSNTTRSEKPGPVGMVQHMPRDALDDKIDELEQRLAGLNAETSPTRSSNASFRTAQEDMPTRLLSHKALGKRKEYNVPKKPDSNLCTQQHSGHQSSSGAQSTSRPTTSQGASTRQSTRRGSTAPTSNVSSASSSKREGRAAPSICPPASSSRRGAAGPDSQGASASSSRNPSFKVNHPAGVPLPAGRPNVRKRRNYPTWPSPVVIEDGRQALQSVRAFSDLRDDYLTAMAAEERLRASSLPILPRRPAADDDDDQSPPNPPEYSNHVPAANIDWTLPSTRRREYRKIDKAHSGVRGFIRRVTPRVWWRKNGRVGFFHDDAKGGSDAGSVRRFRMDVADEEGGGGDGDRAWWRFGRKMGKGKGKTAT